MALDYSRVAQGWVSTFEQVRLHAYVEAPEWDVRCFFAERYLPGAGKLVLPDGRDNMSMRWPLAQAFRGINKAFPLWLPGAKKPNPRNLRARRAVGRFLRNVGPEVALSKSQVRVVQARFGVLNRQFSEHFLPAGESL